MRYLIAICALSLSMGAFAKNIDSTISEIELEKAAQCHEIKSPIGFCLNLVCINYVTFQCFGDQEPFKVKLKVVTQTLVNGQKKETVKKIKYIK